jgi:hypothetical protein
VESATLVSMTVRRTTKPCEACNGTGKVDPPQGTIRPPGSTSWTAGCAAAPASYRSTDGYRRASSVSSFAAASRSPVRRSASAAGASTWCVSGLACLSAWLPKRSAGLSLAACNLTLRLPEQTVVWVLECNVNEVLLVVPHAEAQVDKRLPCCCAKYASVGIAARVDDAHAAIQQRHLWRPGLHWADADGVYGVQATNQPLTDCERRCHLWNRERQSNEQCRGGSQSVSSPGMPG